MLCRLKNIVIFVGGAFSLDMSILAKRAGFQLIQMRRKDTSVRHRVTLLPYAVVYSL